MKTATPSKEIIDVIKESGGEAFKLCYQCGLCDTVCPWNRVRTFSMRKLVRQAAWVSLASSISIPAPDEINCG